MKYKVGDRVRVITNAEGKRYYMENREYSDTMVAEMLNWCGKVVTIKSADETRYTIKECGYNWTDEMFEGLAEDAPKPPTPKYKVGDKVRVRKDLKEDVMYYMADKSDYWYFYDEDMGQYLGSVVTIKIAHKCFYIIEEDELENEWSDEMFEGLAEEKPTNKLNVGDKFIVIKANIKGKEKFIGKTFTVTHVNPNGKKLDPHYDVSEEHGCIFVWFEDEIEKVEKATPAAPITVNLNINIDIYANSCWHCRKGGIVDLYLNSKPGICPSCGRVCNVIPKSEPKFAEIVSWDLPSPMPKENKPLTTDELKALPDGTRVFVAWEKDGEINWDDVRTRWRVKRDNKLHWENGSGHIGIDNVGFNWNAYREEPEKPKEESPWDELPF